jgi:hypothetical protein
MEPFFQVGGGNHVVGSIDDLLSKRVNGVAGL